jgi:predicted dienelactone hydrolase
VKLLLKLLLGLALMLLALLIWATLAHQPQPLAEGSLGARRLAPGPYTVASYTATFVDDSRPTPANGDYPGSPRRELPGEVWYPENPAAGPAPLLLFSHGFTSTYRNGNYLAQHLASHGFVVVAVDFPLTSLGAPGGANVADVASQPGDLSFLIDRLILDSRSSGHALEGHLDGERMDCQA